MYIRHRGQRAALSGVCVVASVALFTIGCVNKTTTAGRSSATQPGVITEYAELRWELGPTTRRVTLERPGDQYVGQWFNDAMEHAQLKRPRPSNTRLSTSSDLLTMLSTQGWELVTHAMSADASETTMNGDPLRTEVWTLRRTVRR